MTSNRKKPSVTFWATVVVVVVLIGYPLSYGPALWAWEKLGHPAWLNTTIDFGYWPLTWALDHGPERLWYWSRLYMLWWMRLGSR